MITSSTRTNLEAYAQNQRAGYDSMSTTRENAERHVASDYHALRDHAPNYVSLMLREYYLRQGRDIPKDGIRNLSFLDVGCGVGRVMEAIVDMGGIDVDGADICQGMLEHARRSPALEDSDFFLTNGRDVGDAPHNAYDIAYSFLCLHHIPMRQTRLRIIESMVECLRPGGMCFVELKMFPGIPAAKIPDNHASWVENKLAKQTNNSSDVWVTFDTLGYVYQDLSLYLRDIFMLEAETDNDHFTCRPDDIYQYSFNPIFVGGFKGSQLSRTLGRRVAAE